MKREHRAAPRREGKINGDERAIFSFDASIEISTGGRAFDLDELRCLRLSGDASTFLQGRCPPLFLLIRPTFLSLACILGTHGDRYDEGTKGRVKVTGVKFLSKERPTDPATSGPRWERKRRRGGRIVPVWQMAPPARTRHAKGHRSGASPRRATPTAAAAGANRISRVAH